MLVVHGSIMSTCTQRVILSFLEMGLVEGKDFKLESVAGRSDIKKPEWMIDQPFGQMPFLVDEESGLRMFESRAIVRYVGSKIGSPLVVQPTTDLAQYAKFETAASVETSDYNSYVQNIFSAGVSPHSSGGKVDQAKVQGFEAEFMKKLEGYEAMLSKSKYVAGNKLTVVDLFHVPFGDVNLEFGHMGFLNNGTFPHVTEWWNRLQALDNWKKVVGSRNEARQAMAAAAQKQ